MQSYFLRSNVYHFTREMELYRQFPGNEDASELLSVGPSDGSMYIGAYEYALTSDRPKRCTLMALESLKQQSLAMELNRREYICAYHNFRIKRVRELFEHAKNTEQYALDPARVLLESGAAFAAQKLYRYAITACIDGRSQHSLLSGLSSHLSELKRHNLF